jgi:hypothetical protein
MSGRRSSIMKAQTIAWVICGSPDRFNRILRRLAHQSRIVSGAARSLPSSTKIISSANARFQQLVGFCDSSLLSMGI